MASLVNNCVFLATSGGTGAFGMSAAIQGYQTPAAAGVVDTTKTYRYRAQSSDLSEWEEGSTVASSTATSFTRVVIASSAGGTTTVNFTAAPTVALTMMAADVLQFDDAMSLTAAQQTQARSNLSVAQLAAMAAHNVVINPALDVSQELGTAGATMTNNTAKYIADQWEAMYNHGAATAVVTSAQITSVSFGSALAGFKFGHQIKATTAISAPASGDFAKHRQKIEGYQIAHWGWGATGAASIVVAFQLYSTVSGTAFVKLSNSDQSRCYYHEITVAAGWNFYAFSVAGDTTGTWEATTSTGLTFEVFVSGKETTPASSLDAWGSTNKVQTTNSTNLLGTANNLSVLTGVYIDVGTQLPTAADLTGLMRPFVSEVYLCKRYWQKSADYTASVSGGASSNGYMEHSSGYAGAASVILGVTVPLVPAMRIAGTITTYDGAGTSGKISTLDAAAVRTDAVTANATPVYESCFLVRKYSQSCAGILYHWTVNSRL